MSKYCEKCGKEMPENSEHNRCENCRAGFFKKLRDGFMVFLAATVIVGGAAYGMSQMNQEEDDDDAEEDSVLDC